ncbi:Lysophospholipid acyltransferase 5, partial [Orchesella cincta]
NRGLSGDQKTQALKRFPSLLESTAHVFYPGSFLIGPQFPMRRYLDFVEGKFGDNGNPPASVAPGLQRLGLGLMYVMIYQLFAPYFNNDTLLSPEFENSNFWWKMLIVGMYGKILLYKYVSCWIVIEGSCILSGISYNGKDKDGEPQWDGCENIGIGLFEKAYKFGHVIASFNKCTNKWVFQNIYKRLKFLNRREISQFAALLFLAVWHGLHSGYYMCFFMEFIVMNSEKAFESLVKKFPTLVRWHDSTLGFWIDVVVSKTFLFVYFGYCMIPFGLLKWRLWTKVYGLIYYNGTILFIAFPFIAQLITMTCVKKSKGKDDGKPDISVKNANGNKQD